MIKVVVLNYKKLLIKDYIYIKIIFEKKIKEELKK